MGPGLDSALSAIVFGQEVDLFFFFDPYEAIDNINSSLDVMKHTGKLQMLKQHGIDSIYSTCKYMNNRDELPHIRTANAEALQLLMQQHSNILSF